VLQQTLLFKTFMCYILNFRSCVAFDYKSRNVNRSMVGAELFCRVDMFVLHFFVIHY